MSTRPRRPVTRMMPNQAALLPVPASTRPKGRELRSHRSVQRSYGVDEGEPRSRLKTVQTLHCDGPVAREDATAGKGGGADQHEPDRQQLTRGNSPTLWARMISQCGIVLRG